MSLEDLRSSEKRGKWWLVGAAWAGDPLTEQAGKTESSVEANEESNASLLKLATKQGMNTDVRRSIFMTLMSSDVGCTCLGLVLSFNFFFRYRTILMLAIAFRN